MKKVLSLAFQIADVPCKLVAVNPRNEQLPENAEALQHKHSGVEIHFVQLGEMTIDCIGGSFVVTEGHMLILPSDLYHFVRKVSPGADRMDILIEIGSCKNSKDAQAKQFFKPLLLSRPIQFCSNEQPTLFAMMDRIRSSVLEYKGDFVQRERLKALGIELVLLLGVAAKASATEPEQAPYESGETDKDRYIMDEFFNRNYRGDSNMGALAKQMHISVRQLSRELRRTYGKSFREKMNECRLAVAVDLLQNTQKSIVEISEILGYSNPVNFSTFVKQQTGRSPSQIRKAKSQK